MFLWYGLQNDIFISCFVTGQNKMVINHLDKLFVTNDAATILRELEVGVRNNLFSKMVLLIEMFATVTENL